MPESGKKTYLISPGLVRILFVGSAVGMVVLLLLFPLLASARPQGRTVLIDRATFQRSLDRSTAAISGYADNGDGTVSIDINDAIELVVARGVANPFTATAGSVTAAAPAGDTEAAGVPAEADGAALYASNCAACHQAAGQGVPGAFPPLAGHTHDLYEAERTYLLDVLLFGLQGQITVAGMPYNGMMPAWPQLSDAEIAALANHITVEWDGEPAGFEAFTADEAAEQRTLALNPTQVHALRSEAGLD
jgi:mono/diheme cytochrome c family protein